MRPQNLDVSFYLDYTAPTTSDDSTRYRDEEEVEEWKKHDPLKRFRNYLKEHEIWDEELEAFEEKAKEKVDEAANKALEMDDPEFDELFDYVYKDMPDLLKKEKEQFRKEADIDG